MSPISFVATEYGSDIIATPTDEQKKALKEMPGEPVVGYFGDSDEADKYEFTDYGSFSGVKFDRAVDGEDIFYFAKGRYLNLHTLVASKPYLYSYPFRGVYKYSASETSKLMSWFDIAYGENPFMGVVTGIDNQEAQADLMVKVGKGEVTLSATRMQDVKIRTISGIGMKSVNLNVGDTRTVKLPAGAYLVNGVKVIVK